MASLLVCRYRIWLGFLKTFFLLHSNRLLCTDTTEVPYGGSPTPSIDFVTFVAMAWQSSHNFTAQNPVSLAETVC